MVDREPFTQRMDTELYERVEARAAELGRTKASVFDEMMRDWLDQAGDRSVGEELQALKRRQLLILNHLSESDEAGGEGDRTELARREQSDDAGETTVGRLAEYDSALPAEYTLSKAALRDVPDRIDDGSFEIDPAHLDIERYPKPVRVKRCLPVAVLRYENDGPVTETRVRDTIQRVLGTERYANRYYSNVVRHLERLPGDGEDEFETGA